MSNRVPYWVGVQQGRARSDSAHVFRELELQNRIVELEKENSDLQNKLAKMENAFLLAVDLLMKKI